MIPYYSFVAYSGAGKTSYLEKLIAELKRRGVRVAVVKHDAHRFEIDKEGKDSWRFAQAGADVVAVADGEKCALMEYRPVPLEKLLSKIEGVDLILVEGWHSEAKNTVALYRASSGSGLKANPRGCAAVVSDTPLDTGDVPLFPLDDPAPMASFLLARL